jgi:hypothetical protein
MVKGKVHLFLDKFLQKKIGVNGRLDNLHKLISFFCIWRERQQVLAYIDQSLLSSVSLHVPRFFCLKLSPF